MYGIKLTPQTSINNNNTPQGIEYFNYNLKARDKVIGDDFCNYIYYGKLDVAFNHKVYYGSISNKLMGIIDSPLRINSNYIADHYEAALTLPSKNCIIAVGECDYPIYVSRRINDTLLVVSVYSDKPVTVPIYYLDTINLGGGSGYGMEAFNSVGEKTFSTNNQYLKINEIINFYESVIYGMPNPLHSGYYKTEKIISSVSNGTLIGEGIRAGLKRIVTGRKYAVLLDSPDLIPAFLMKNQGGYFFYHYYTATRLKNNSLDMFFIAKSTMTDRLSAAVDEFAPYIYKVRPKVIIDVTGF
ncbi:MAG: hypothetical protein Q4G42_05125 [Neisseria sp.]|nr:hypothetical protein [Neisseria sp.]